MTVEQEAVVRRIQAIFPGWEIERASRVQSLWSGYGAVWRVSVSTGGPSSVICKVVTPGGGGRHPRGFASDLGHARKLRSYAAEEAFYRDYSEALPSLLPRAYHLEANADGWFFIFEDLSATGFPARRSQLAPAELKACLRYLAQFHAAFLGREPVGLWEEGTYWHLETRPDELKVMQPGPLKNAAESLASRLKGARFRTLVHGDAKAENFCFPLERPDESGVRAVDFQYVGGGVGIKDVAYFFSSCLNEDALEKNAEPLLDVYFSELKKRIAQQHPALVPSLVEDEWRELYPVAWADFLRFLGGWAPDHYKVHRYSRGLTSEALARL